MNASTVAGARPALPALCAALGLEARAAEAIALFEQMRGPETGRRDGGDPQTPGAGAFPAYALSLALGPRAAEVRFRVEPGRLLDRLGNAIEPLDRVLDLCQPAAGGHPASWPVVVLQGAAPPRFEVYVDAQAQGRWKATAVAEEALLRLGLGRAWPSMAERALRRGLYLDELRYLSIDLGDGTAPRAGAHAPITLHVAHHDASAADVRAALGTSPLAARAEELCLALTGFVGPYRAAPIVTSHAFGAPGAPEPTASALHVPVAAYAPTDAVTRGRVSAYLALQGLSSEAYEGALASYAGGPLAAQHTLHGYVGRREDEGGPSVTIDFDGRPREPREAHATAAPQPPTDTAPPPPEEIVRRFENDIVLADHPFLRRTAREPVQLGHLWLMIANFWEGIVHDFPRRLAQVIATVDDDRIRSVLTKQLNDELGEGRFEDAHKAMFQALVRAVEPYRMEGSDEVLLAPGRAFGKELLAMMLSDDPYEAVGAMMMIEVYGKQTDLFMGSQFRRQDRIDDKALHWLHLHEGLEVDHADDSLTLAHCVPRDPAAIAAAWRRAEAVVTAGRHYFDAFYRICFA